MGRSLLLLVLLLLMVLLILLMLLMLLMLLKVLLGQSNVLTLLGLDGSIGLGTKLLLEKLLRALLGIHGIQAALMLLMLLLVRRHIHSIRSLLLDARLSRGPIVSMQLVVGKTVGLGLVFLFVVVALVRLRLVAFGLDIRRQGWGICNLLWRRRGIPRAICDVHARDVGLPFLGRDID